MLAVAICMDCEVPNFPSRYNLDMHELIELCVPFVTDAYCGPVNGLGSISYRGKYIITADDKHLAIQLYISKL